MPAIHRALTLTMAVIVLLGLAAERATAADPNPPASPSTPAAMPVPPQRVLTGIVPDLPPGYMVVEGDIQVPIPEFERRYRQFYGGVDGQSPEDTYQTNLWPNGVVPYEFDANVIAANQTAMQNAMQQWQNIANVQFMQCAGNACFGDFVHIQSSTANNSAVGRRGGRQTINIANWNNTWIMAHELGHALGLEHEQNRSDRNASVTINFNNICKATDTNCRGGFCMDQMGNRIDCDFNFDLQNDALSYGRYDFDSLMHYGRTDFSRATDASGVWLDTITVLAPNDTQWQTVIGQRARLSEADKNTAGCLYPRPEWRWVSTTSFPPFWFGSCAFPYATMVDGVANTPGGGTLWIEPGYYAAAGVYSKPMTLKAPNGPVTIGN